MGGDTRGGGWGVQLLPAGEFMLLNNSFSSLGGGGELIGIRSEQCDGTRHRRGVPPLPSALHPPTTNPALWGSHCLCVPHTYPPPKLGLKAPFSGSPLAFPHLKTEPPPTPVPAHCGAPRGRRAAFRVGFFGVSEAKSLQKRQFRVPGAAPGGAERLRAARARLSPSLLSRDDRGSPVV